jgi:alanine-synthesizing transaminase
MPVSADRVVITSGTSEGIELTLTALAGPGDEVLVPVPTYPLYTAVLAKIGARPLFYRTDPGSRLDARPGSHSKPHHAANAGARRHRSEQPDGARTRRTCGDALIEIADEHNLPLLADEVYADLHFDGPVPALASLDPDAPVISFSSLSKAYLAPGWRAGWMAVGRTDRLDEVLGGVKKLADGRLCSTGPMEHAIVAALNGDRSHQVDFRAALRERAVLTHERLNAIPGITSVMPSAAFYAMPRVTLPTGAPTRTTCWRCCAPRASSACTARASALRPGRRVLPRGLPGLPGRTVEHLRGHRRLHG